MNTKEGGKTLRDTLIEKHGSEAAWRKYMAEIGAIGGRKGHTGGFWVNRELARIVGAKGGRISRRGQNK